MVNWKGGFDPDPDRFLDALRDAAVGKGYTKKNLYLDLREVFGSEAGKRVLWQLLEWCHVYNIIAVRGDPHQTYFKDGARSIGLKILAAMNMEPLERELEAQSEEPEDG